MGPGLDRSAQLADRHDLVSKSWPVPRGQGEQGPRGGAGPPGHITEDEARAACKKLLDEFAADIAGVQKEQKGLESEVGDLGRRVAGIEEDLERPRVTGWIDYRIGLAGDLWAHAGFDALTTKIGIEGQVTKDLRERITLKAVDDAQRVAAAGFAPLVSDPLGLSDSIWLDEGSLAFKTNWLTPAEWTVGRQFFSYGLGLVTDDDRLSIQGVRWHLDDIAHSSLALDAFAGFSFYDEGQFFGIRDDEYAAYRLAFVRPSWHVGGTHLVDGVGHEQAWGADMRAKLWGRNLAFEYAQMRRDAYKRPTGDAAAWMGTVDLINAPSLKVAGIVSRSDPRYTPTYSVLFPYYEVLQRDLPTGAIPWERWMRNAPIFPGAQAVAAVVTTKAGNTAFDLRYINVHALAGAVPVPSQGFELGGYNNLLALSATQRIVDGLNLVVGWGHEFAGESGLDDIDLLEASTVVSF